MSSCFTDCSENMRHLSILPTATCSVFFEEHRRSLLFFENLRCAEMSPFTALCLCSVLAHRLGSPSFTTVRFNAPHAPSALQNFPLSSFLCVREGCPHCDKRLTTSWGLGTGPDFSATATNPPLLLHYVLLVSPEILCARRRSMCNPSIENYLVLGFPNLGFESVHETHIILQKKKENDISCARHQTIISPTLLIYYLISAHFVFQKE